MSGYIVGLDIGSSKICASLGKCDRQGELQILGITSVSCNGLKKGIVVDIDSTTEAVKNCIEKLERMADIQIKSVYISIPGGICDLIKSTGVIAISSEDREIKSNDIERVHKAARVIAISSDKQIIGIIPEQYTVDGYTNVKDPLGMSGIRLEVEAKIIVAQTTVIENLCKSVNKAGLNIDGIVLQSTAISKVVLKNEEKRMGTAIVDAGAETIDISIYKDENLVYTTMIPIGGSSITNDIAICLKVPYSIAEELKTKHYHTLQKHLAAKSDIKVFDSYNHEISVDSRMLYEVIEARVEELLFLIKKELVKSGFYEDIAGIVMVGGGLSMFDDICQLGMKNINKPIRLGTPDFSGAESPIYASVCGIVKDKAHGIKNFNLEHEKKLQSNSMSANEAVFDGYDDEDEDEKQVGILTKIKDFFTDFF